MYKFTRYAMPDEEPRGPVLIRLSDINKVEYNDGYKTLWYLDHRYINVDISDEDIETLLLQQLQPVLGMYQETRK